MKDNKTNLKKENMTMRALYLMAIVFVVDGHTTLADMFDMQNLFRYYSFQLMLFMFAAGYFFKPGDVDHPLPALVRKAKKLLIPLYAWNVVYGLGAAFLRKYGGFSFGEPVTLYNLLIAPLTTGHQFVWNQATWFVFPFFLAQVVYTFVRKASKLWGDRDILTFLLCLIPGCICVTLCRNEMQSALPLFLMRTLILLPGYAAGVFYRRHLEKHDTMRTVPYLMIVVVLRALLCVRYPSLTYLAASCDYFGCDAFGVYAGGALAIAFYLRIARLIAPYMERSKLALSISRNTFAIMTHHYMGFFALDAVFVTLHILGIAAKDFSMSKWRTMVAYMYAPGSRPEWDILYLMAGLLFPLMIVFVMDKAKSFIRKKLGR